MDVQINYLAVLSGAIIYFAGGSIWYSKMLFGKTWMAGNGLTEKIIKDKHAEAWKAYLTAFISALLIS